MSNPAPELNLQSRYFLQLRSEHRKRIARDRAWHEQNRPTP